MKNGKSKVMLALATCSLCLSMFSVNPVTTLASGTGGDPTITVDVKTKEQSKAEIVKEKQLADYKVKRATEREQFKVLKNQLATVGTVSTTATSGQKELAIQYFQQQTGYWCGPATTKQMLHFINGSSQTQQYYATALGTNENGTDFSLVDNVLNANQTGINYLYYTVADMTNFQSRIDYNIDIDFPTALDLRITSANMPKYTSTVEGHILNTSGYDYIYATEDELRLTDPYDQGGRGVTLGNVWHPYAGVYNANQLHFRKAIIW